VQGGVTFEGKHYRLAGTLRGPAPAHDIGIWVGAFKPRMLRLVGRLADGWWPTAAGLNPGDLTAGNAVIDAAAVDAPARETAAHDPGAIANFASEVAPRVKEAVEEARLRGPTAASAVVEAAEVGSSAPTEAEEAAPGETEVEPVGGRPRPDEAIRLSDRAPWDDSTRPRRDRSGPDVTYTDQGRRVSKQLIAVHDMLRGELSGLRHILRQVRDEAIQAGQARAALNEMVLRQNDWTLGTVCARYCAVVGQHHGAEDAAMFPHLALREPQLTPVIDRLTEEHLVIHDAIQDVDRALVRHMTRPENHDAIQAAIDYLTDALLSHLAYEEQELVEPLARLGFYPDQVPVTS
jgi:Hemerythrin HHE cation binding domain/Luciferase-like monooxygenase